MTKYEDMKHEFFSLLKSVGTRGYYIQPFLLAGKYEIETMHLREKLIEWAEARLISLEVSSGNGFRPYTDWPNTDEFFEYGNKVGHVRVKLLAAGDEYLERLREIKHRPIGFEAKAG